MKTLIVSCHPYDKSFNYTLCDAMAEKLKEKHTVDLVNLVEDGFDPVMHGKDLYLWRTGKTEDQLVAKYMTLLKECDIVVFAFPIWWLELPAIMKGFCDKVLLPGFAYYYDENHNMVPSLVGKMSVVVTTMETPLDIYTGYFGNPIENSFIKGTLNTCGIESLNYFQIDQISSSGKEYSTEKFNEVIDYIATL